MLGGAVFCSSIFVFNLSSSADVYRLKSQQPFVQLKNKIDLVLQAKQFKLFAILHFYRALTLPVGGTSSVPKKTRRWCSWPLCIQSHFTLTQWHKESKTWGSEWIELFVLLLTLDAFTLKQMEESGGQLICKLIRKRPDPATLDYMNQQNRLLPNIILIIKWCWIYQLGEKRAF